MRQAEGVGGVRLLGRDHATPWPLVGRRGTREHDGDDEAVAIHDGRPHVEIEAAVGFVPGLDERGLERLEAGDPTQAQVERGTADAVVAAGRQCREPARGNAEPRNFGSEGMETEHDGILRVVGWRTDPGMDGLQDRSGVGVQASGRRRGGRSRAGRRNYVRDGRLASRVANSGTVATRSCARCTAISASPATGRRWLSTAWRSTGLFCASGLPRSERLRRTLQPALKTTPFPRGRANPLSPHSFPLWAQAY